MSSEEQPLPNDPETLDVVFDLLSHSLRRSLLTELRVHDRPQALADLAKAVAVQQQDTSLDDVPKEELKQIHTALYHTHIPKLEDKDAISFDPGQNTVTLTAHGERLCSYLDRMTERSAQPQLEE